MRLHAKHSLQEAAPQANGHRPPGSPPLSDDEVIELCRNAKNGPKFERLFYHGDLSEYGDDDCRADQGLVSIMAFYTQDQEQLDGLFRRSALYRAEKWGRRQDYRHRTIQKALSDLTETYTPSDDGARMVVGSDGNLASPSSYIDRDAGTIILCHYQSPSALRHLMARRSQSGLRAPSGWSGSGSPGAGPTCLPCRGPTFEITYRAAPGPACRRL